MVSPKSGESDLKSEEGLPKIQATENNDFDLDGSLFEKDSLLKSPEEEASAEKMEVDPKLEAMEVETKMDVDKEEEEKWAKGEKILCFHGPLIYEAKIQEVELQNSIPKYFIHYKGWNKNWDEWVPEARMLKHTEDNVEHQKDLCRAHEAKEASRK